MKKLFFFLILAIPFKSKAQAFYTGLYGFKLEQYRAAVKTELGKPFKSGKFDDGFDYEVFALKSDRSLYMIFEYSPEEKDVVWSIQVSGNINSGDIGFRGLKLGMSKAEIIALLGKPSTTENIGEYGDKWVYDGTNFSLEINKLEKLSSVKIMNTSHELFPKGPDVKKIPSFDRIRTVLNSGSNADILNLLSGDVEVYYKQKVYAFEKSFKTEGATDYSTTLSIIKAISKDLDTVDIHSNYYEENMRIGLGVDVRHVIKIKSGHQVKEIVLKYFGGEYYIYEINANDN
ncbi:hypothetical protein [Mucilaginibacter psychrotolerans]|uniref:Uncharacterized protein n=1 Tax=Mucilaginibacter psychrotolerans TaxID=1524096 RepID=A0A4Y8SNK0_9SPHI|nr:hypothetical protein [Mucilaginibacter psychrotolerans]TFF40211.1 hypothetical protein E2R66_02880 [Mucilaginibacter psychrotolerans]